MSPPHCQCSTLRRVKARISRYDHHTSEIQNEDNEKWVATTRMKGARDDKKKGPRDIDASLGPWRPPPYSHIQLPLPRCTTNADHHHHQIEHWPPPPCTATIYHHHPQPLSYHHLPPPYRLYSHEHQVLPAYMHHHLASTTWTTTGARA